MPDRMSPPGSPQHGVAIVIAAHPSSSGNGRMSPPGTKPDDPMAAPDDATPGKDKDGKTSPEDAQVIREDQHCGDCKNYDATSGACSKVSGNFSPEDGCLMYFEAMQESDEEPGADDQGGAPDADTDDQAPPAAQ